MKGLPSLIVPNLGNVRFFADIEDELDKDKSAGSITSGLDGFKEGLGDKELGELFENFEDDELLDVEDSFLVSSVGFDFKGSSFTSENVCSFDKLDDTSCLSSLFFCSGFSFLVKCLDSDELEEEEELVIDFCCRATCSTLSENNDLLTFDTFSWVSSSLLSRLSFFFDLLMKGLLSLRVPYDGCLLILIFLFGSVAFLVGFSSEPEEDECLEPSFSDLENEWLLDFVDSSFLEEFTECDDALDSSLLSRISRSSLLALGANGLLIFKLPEEGCRPILIFLMGILRFFGFSSELSDDVLDGLDSFSSFTESPDSGDL